MSDAERLAALRLKHGTAKKPSDKERLLALRAAHGPGVTGQDRYQAAVQGYTAGFSDEIAGIYRGLAGDYNYDFGEGGPAPVDRSFRERYESGRDQVRNDLNAFRDKAPGEALAWELGGATLPAVMTLGASASTSAPSTANTLKTAAALGAAGGAGYSEGETAKDVAVDAGIGGAVGLAAVPVVNTLGQLGSAVFNRVRASIGDKPAAAVVRELQRLAKDTGKSIDEIVDDIANGRVMAENQTLNASIRAMKSEGGEAGALIDKMAAQRRDITRDRAGRTIRNQLTDGDGLDANLLRQAQADDKLAWELENAAYGSVFENPRILPDEIADDLLSAAGASKKVQKTIDEVYQARGQKPLFVKEDGVLSYSRAPTLEDAEMARRVLRDQSSAFMMPGKGKGAVGAELSSLRTALEKKLNVFAPDLEQARANAQTRRAIIDAFNDGRKALTQDVDEVELLVEKYRAQGDDVISAFRRGLAQATQGKSRKQQNIMAKLSDPGRQEGAVMETALDGAPNANLPKLFRDAETANIADWNYNRLMHQSPTSDTMLARDRLYGTAETLVDAARMQGNDPTAGLRFISAMVNKFTPTMTDAQRKQVVKVLFSTDANLVRRAFEDPRAMTAMQNRISEIATDVTAMQGAPQSNYIGVR